MAAKNRLFRDLRNEPINLIEFGVGRGGSLRMWSEYFPRAVVVGTDPHVECRWHAGERRIVETLAQDDPRALHALGTMYSPTIVIDNGSHRADDIVRTFEQLYPLLRNGGYYVVECLHFHAGGGAGHWRGNAATPPQDYFLQLARLLACPESDVPFDRTIVALTDSIEFIYGGVVVRRRQGSSGVDPIALHRPLVERANKPTMWMNFAMLVLNNGGDPQEAVLACQKALTLDATEPSFHYQLSVSLERAGDLDGAIEACRASVRLHPALQMFQDRLAGLQRKRTETPVADAVGDG